MAARVTVDGFRVIAGPGGETVVVRLTMPEKLLMLVMLRPNVAEDPAVIVTPLGFADSTKPGTVLVENIALWVVSGTALIEPLAIVMQTGGSLVGAVDEPQPVWKPRLVPDVELVML